MSTSEQQQPRRGTSASIQGGVAIKVQPSVGAENRGGIESIKAKRFSLAHIPRQDRRVTIRPYESFRERKDSQIQDNITFGYAALSTVEEDAKKSIDYDVEQDVERATSPTPSVFSIYGDEPGPSSTCEQPVGAQADVFISSLPEKKLTQIRKFIENQPREENMYFLWVKDSSTNKITVISLKTLENYFKNDSRVRRVKWRHLSSDRVSIYRYSLPAITYEKSKLCKECLCRHKKLCLLMVWLAFVLFLCLVVVLGSISPDDRAHPFAHHNRNNSTQVNTSLTG
ncbi:unnamed protein product [Caenorhabditis angaria]|uniref:Uncharacterized protein n=1 Tax=Caenorhabditis angaria TaxID=860376 RepID=A0A9P1INP6_9PELO|nr:unnamed protein product [Caenorhabditis angaria]